MLQRPPPLPPFWRERLLRGPLILSAINRVLLIPFYLICALGSSMELKIFRNHLADYRLAYVVDKVALAVTMWAFLFLSVVLAVLFFARCAAFRPLMVYFSCLLLLLLVGIGIHGTYFHPVRAGRRTHDDPAAAYEGLALLAAAIFWPLYYGFSPQVKRVFTR